MAGVLTTDRGTHNIEHDPEVEDVEECSTQTAVPDDVSSHHVRTHEYTKEWVEKVDHGGLFTIDNEILTYSPIQALES